MAELPLQRLQHRVRHLRLRQSGAHCYRGARHHPPPFIDRTKKRSPGAWPEAPLSRYSRERLLAFNARLQERRPDIVERQRDIQLGEADVRDLVAFLLELL